MERAHKGTFEYRPEALDALHVDLSPDVFAAAVAHRVVPEMAHAPVGAVLVGVDRGVIVDSVLDEPLQGVGVGIVDHGTPRTRLVARSFTPATMEESRLFRPGFWPG